MIQKDHQFQISKFNEIYVSRVANMQRTWIERCDAYRRNQKEPCDKDVHTAFDMILWVVFGMTAKTKTKRRM